MVAEALSLVLPHPLTNAAFPTKYELEANERGTIEIAVALAAGIIAVDK